MTRIITMHFGICVLLMCSSLAQAQPGRAPYGPPQPSGYYYPPPPGPALPPPPPPQRYGFVLGLDLGGGGMTINSNPAQCYDCSGGMGAGSFGLHAGWLLNPRLAILAEFWGTGQAPDDYMDETLTQAMVLLAAQYWLTPQFWIKGGIGGADLTVQTDNGYNEPVDEGGAMMAAAGYEIVSSPTFALDLQFRSGVARYEYADSVRAFALSLGLNWY